MKILVFSLGVVFKNEVQGGSQRVLKDVSMGLAQRGHEVTIICPLREDNKDTFNICDRVVVKPVLPLRGAFPVPYAVSPFSLSETYKAIESELDDVDLLYCHDGGLLFEGLKKHVPTVISLRDFCYQETLLGALNFHGEAIIVNSRHTQSCLQDTFMQINPTIRGKDKLIFNGYDPEVFQRKEISEQFYSEYNLPPKTDDLIIGLPHRPEMSKGFENALQVLKRLVHTFNKHIKMLIPLYMDRGLSTRTDDLYIQLEKLVKDLGLQENVIYHDWVRYEMMPEYYSYCDLVLCIGNFVEAFSNVSVEALLCETPVVTTNTATYRTMPIKQFVPSISYGDIDGTAHMMEEILKDKPTVTLKKARNYISENLSITKMVDAYERTFLDALDNTTSGTGAKLSTTNSVSCIEGKYKLPAWCFVENSRIFNDYNGIYVDDPFKGAFTDAGEKYTKGELIKKGISAEQIATAISDGLLVSFYGV